MLRLTLETDDAAGPVLRAEGRIVAEWATLLDQECRALLQHHAQLCLELSGVSYVDRAGVRVLRGFAPGRLRLEGCSPLLREILGQKERA